MSTLREILSSGAEVGANGPRPERRLGKNTKRRIRFIYRLNRVDRRVDWMSKNRKFVRVRFQIIASMCLGCLNDCQ